MWVDADIRREGQSADIKSKTEERKEGTSDKNRRSPIINKALKVNHQLINNPNKLYILTSHLLVLKYQYAYIYGS